MLRKFLKGFRRELGSPKSLEESGSRCPEHLAGSSCADLQVEIDSNISLIMKVSPAVAAAYVDSVIAEIARCTRNCQIAAESATIVDIFEKIHGLKNAISPTGSPELFKACEQLRVDASGGIERSLIEQRYIAIANAALNHIANFKATNLAWRHLNSVDAS